MIFKKDVNFPYPVLSPFTSDYKDSYFGINVDLEDHDSMYKFKVKMKLECRFLEELISAKRAKMFLVVESQDVKFYEFNGQDIVVNKNRISLSKRTFFQMYISTIKRVPMRDNVFLDEFYDDKKTKMFLDAGSVLAISNVEKFDGDLKKPFDLFEKMVDANIKSDIKIELGTELIMIKYKTPELQYKNMRRRNTLNNHYVYLGLQKALMLMIKDLGENDELLIENLDDVDNKVYRKIQNLLKVKRVANINYENLDEVIYKISDRILEKHTIAVKELETYES